MSALDKFKLYYEDMEDAQRDKLLRQRKKKLASKNT